MLVVVRQGVHALLDGVLVATRERRVHQVAGVGMAGMDRQAVAVLGHAAQVVDVVQVELGVDALGEKVEREGDHVHVAGALAVAEQGALDPVGAGQLGQFGGRDRGAPVVVGVNAEDDRVPVAGMCRPNHSITSA